jgi:hypothetical protein
MGALTGAAQVQVSVRRIPATGFAALAAPLVVSDTTLPVTDGRVTIPISGSVLWDAYAITITPAGGPAPPSGLRLTRIRPRDRLAQLHRLAQGSAVRGAAGLRGYLTRDSGYGADLH